MRAVWVGYRGVVEKAGCCGFSQNVIIGAGGLKKLKKFPACNCL